MNDDPLLIYKVEQLQSKVDSLRSDIEEMQREREAAERKRLMWGIGALGTAVLTLAGVIWAMLPHSAQEAWDVLRGGNSR
jgi:uncharacterized membrane protein